MRGFGGENLRLPAGRVRPHSGRTGVIWGKPVRPASLRPRGVPTLVWKDTLNMRRILVTSALPYANGHIHIGHLVEYLQTDIWVRFQKLRGNRCVYMCADDTHGTAIMIRARQRGHRRGGADRADAEGPRRATSPASTSSSTTTAAPTARRTGELCDEIWAVDPRSAGWSAEQEVDQLYDTEAGTFLADRFVKGTCPKLQAAPDQYGDNCDKCGAPLQPRPT